MMMMDMMAKMIQAVDNGDAYIDFMGGYVEFTVNDFDGFDADWNEVDHEFKDEALVDEILDFLKNACDYCKDDFYRKYYFGDAVVELGFSSYDI